MFVDFNSPFLSVCTGACVFMYESLNAMQCERMCVCEHTCVCGQKPSKKNWVCFILTPLLIITMVCDASLLWFLFNCATITNMLNLFRFLYHIFFFSLAATCFMLYNVWQLYEYVFDSFWELCVDAYVLQVDHILTNQDSLQKLLAAVPGLDNDPIAMCKLFVILFLFTPLSGYCVSSFSFFFF